jgi:hypothetical protein
MSSERTGTRTSLTPPLVFDDPLKEMAGGLTCQDRRCCRAGAEDANAGLCEQCVALARSPMPHIRSSPKRLCRARESDTLVCSALQCRCERQSLVCLLAKAPAGTPRRATVRILVEASPQRSTASPGARRAYDEGERLTSTCTSGFTKSKVERRGPVHSKPGAMELDRDRDAVGAEEVT